MYELLIFLVLMALGYFFGRAAEHKHYKSIIEREKKTLSLPVTTLKTLPPQAASCTTRLVTGNVVISIDFFKKFLASLRTLFGGRVTSYETLLDRARREAILRMKESAIADGANMIINVRIETASISKSSSGRESVGSVEVVAYGTALSPL